MQGPIAAAYFLRIHRGSSPSFGPSANDRAQGSKIPSNLTIALLLIMFVTTAIVIYCHLFAVVPSRSKHSSPLLNQSNSGKLVGLAILAIHKSYPPTSNHSSIQEKDVGRVYEREILRLQRELKNLRKKMDAVILDESKKPHREDLAPTTDVMASISDRNDQESKMTTKPVNDKIFQDNKLFQHHYNQSRKE
ncbi:uncharacterized protein LOC103315561 [Nasonia vitripennis]|uniref:Uncharacterized protein n=1 Tax=Nasonia vitripennis TaxID=7425 RepID=A0A7M7H1K2_NASVI|nr:uncharacterized protein LOC103315561 [Nasonia vitripennis]